MFFDPLGLLSPLTLKAKLLFQEVCSLKLDWDCKIEDQALVHRWDSFLWDLENLNHLEICRHVLCCSHRVVQLHGFCDASGKSYCACVYIRVACPHVVNVRLLTSKNRLVPSKPLSIPRLELLSCVLLSRLIDSVQKALESEVVLEKICLWSDSQVALWWLKQVNKRWNVWVQNKVELIRALVEPSRWYYVSTHSNPADLSTRFNSLKSFRFNSLWWEGPSYLKQDCSHWPLEEIISSDLAHQEERSGNHSLTIMELMV